jgi:hypothetical protein
MTEVQGEGLADGIEIVTGIQSGSVAPSISSSQGDTTTQSDTKNPFLPKMPAPPKGGPRGGPPPM